MPMIYLSVFLGIAPYFLLKTVVKNWKVVYSIFISVLLAGSIIFVNYEKSTFQGLMSEFHWQHIQWVRQSVPEDAVLLYFYGDPYDQEAILWNLKRLSFRVKIDDYVNSINERMIRKTYNAEVAAADDAELLYRKSAFSFGYHAKEFNRSLYSGKQDICRFDYFVFDKVGRQQTLADFNLLVANELVKAGGEVVFDNGVVLIVKNNNLGGKCIEERSF